MGGTTMTITTKKSLSVYGTPDVQQRIAENIAHIQRPETKNARFVMEINYLTLGDVQESSASDSEKVLWRKNRYGLITIESGTSTFLPEKIGEGIESPLHPYLHPIPNQKASKDHSGIEFYWVAKENIPKMQDAWDKHVHSLKGSSLFREHFRSQPVITSNGQQGVYVGDFSFPFTLSEKKWYKSSPTNENILSARKFS
jgi:hypothetical protein